MTSRIICAFFFYKSLYGVIEMSTSVKTLLLINNSSTNYTYSFLFQCAAYGAQQGNRVLFISQNPLKCLPLPFGKTDLQHNPDAFKLIQFMYLANCKELLQQLFSIHFRHNPISIIIIKNLENYFKVDSQVDNIEENISLVCASLLHAASVCSKLTSKPSFLILDYKNENTLIDKNIIKNYFQNIWHMEINKNDNEIKLSKLSPPKINEIVSYKLEENLNESNFTFTEIIRKVVDF